MADAAPDREDRFGSLQDWQVDPWERYEQRYFSRGVPTRLVRNGHAEAHDEPVGPLPEPPPPPPPAPPPDPAVIPIILEPSPIRSRWRLLYVVVAAVAPFIVLTAFASQARIFVLANLIVLYGAVALLVFVGRVQRRSGIA
jgi:hypothetical protein